MSTINCFLKLNECFHHRWRYRCLAGSVRQVDLYARPALELQVHRSGHDANGLKCILQNSPSLLLIGDCYFSNFGHVSVFPMGRAYPAVISAGVKRDTLQAARLRLPPRQAYAQFCEPLMLTDAKHLPCISTLTYHLTAPVKSVGGSSRS